MHTPLFLRHMHTPFFYAICAPLFFFNKIDLGPPKPIIDSSVTAKNKQVYQHHHIIRYPHFGSEHASTFSAHAR